MCGGTRWGTTHTPGIGAVCADCVCRDEKIGLRRLRDLRHSAISASNESRTQPCIRAHLSAVQTLAGARHIRQGFGLYPVPWFPRVKNSVLYECECRTNAHFISPHMWNVTREYKLPTSITCVFNGPTMFLTAVSFFGKIDFLRFVIT